MNYLTTCLNYLWDALKPVPMAGPPGDVPRGRFNEVLTDLAYWSNDPNLGIPAGVCASVLEELESLHKVPVPTAHVKGKIVTLRWFTSGYTASLIVGKTHYIWTYTAKGAGKTQYGHGDRVHLQDDPILELSPFIKKLSGTDPKYGLAHSR